MGEKFRKGFLKVMEPLEPYFDSIGESLLPALKWIKKWIWLIGLLICLAMYIWKSIIHHYVDDFSIGQALSVAFGEMLVVIFVIVITVFVGWILTCVLTSVLVTWLNQNIEKRKAKADVSLIHEQTAKGVPIIEENPEVPTAEEISELEEINALDQMVPDIQKEDQAQPESTTDDSSDEQIGYSEQEVIDASEDNGDLPKKGPHAISHREDQGNEYPVIIDRDEFRKHLIDGFVRTAFGSNHNSFEILCDQLESRSWTTTDLCRIGLFILESKVVKGSMTFAEWLPLFFKLMNREKDCPVKAIPSNYSDFRKSGIDFKRDFSDLYRLYKSHGQTKITFKP